jgi:hypothetical protein
VLCSNGLRKGGLKLKARGEEFLYCVDLLVEAAEKKADEGNDKK